MNLLITKGDINNALFQSDRYVKGSLYILEESDFVKDYIHLHIFKGHSAPVFWRSSVAFSNISTQHRFGWSRTATFYSVSIRLKWVAYNIFFWLILVVSVVLLNTDVIRSSAGEKYQIWHKVDTLQLVTAAEFTRSTVCTNITDFNQK